MNIFHTIFITVCVCISNVDECIKLVLFQTAVTEKKLKFCSLLLHFLWSVGLLHRLPFSLPSSLLSILSLSLSVSLSHHSEEREKEEGRDSFKEVIESLSFPSSLSLSLSLCHNVVHTARCTASACSHGLPGRS